MQRTIKEIVATALGIATKENEPLQLNIDNEGVLTPERIQQLKSMLDDPITPEPNHLHIDPEEAKLTLEIQNLREQITNLTKVNQNLVTHATVSMPDIPIEQSLYEMFGQQTEYNAFQQIGKEVVLNG